MFITSSVLYTREVEELTPSVSLLRKVPLRIDLEEADADKFEIVKQYLASTEHRG
jgi:hypothetical protein